MLAPPLCSSDKDTNRKLSTKGSRCEFRKDEEYATLDEIAASQTEAIKLREIVAYNKRERSKKGQYLIIEISNKWRSQIDKITAWTTTTDQATPSQKIKRIRDIEAIKS